jgi:type II secretory pathway pseudopilin PulG
MTRRNPPGGFTLIEVLLVIVLTVFGFLGLLSLQARTVQALGEARDQTEATTLGEHFVETVKLEAASWQNDLTLGWNQPAFRYLKNADQGWLNAFLDNGTAHMVSKDGNDDVPGTGLDRGILTEFAGAPRKYCVFYRLTSLVANNVFRLEARVLFRRSNGTWPQDYQQCRLDRMVHMIRDSANTASVSLLTTVAKNLVGP